jgi:Zn-dependent protease
MSEFVSKVNFRDRLCKLWEGLLSLWCSIRLGRLWGIDVFVHSTFILFLCYFGLAEWLDAMAAGGTGWAAASLAGNMVALICAIFGCVLLHEYGHALTARYFGIGTVDITLLPIGGVARLERIPERPRQELLVAVAGPAVNLVIVVLLLAGFGVMQVVDLEGLSQHRGDLMHKLNVWSSFSRQLLMANVAMIVFNAIPAFPMDGGRVLRALLAMRIDRVKATQIAVGVGKVVALGLAIYGVRSHHQLLIFTATFVWIGATRELEDVRQQQLSELPFPASTSPSTTTTSPTAAAAQTLS